MITELKPNQVFVFGSNAGGHHYGGAALQALQWGAKIGVAVGIAGQTYAIPTLGIVMEKLPLDVIKHYLEQLDDFARTHPGMEFLLTSIGTGIAGFEPEEIESIMPNFPTNVIKV